MKRRYIIHVHTVQESTVAGWSCRTLREAMKHAQTMAEDYPNGVFQIYEVTATECTLVKEGDVLGMVWKRRIVGIDA